MSSQLADLLQTWHAQRAAARWALGTVYETERSSYRKAGAMMLFNDLGQQFGVLSGGCLDSELHRRARQVMDTGRSLCLAFDSADEDDISYQFGIGCGGVVRVLLQPLRDDNAMLDLERVRQALSRREAGLYRQRIVSGEAPVAEFVTAAVDEPRCGAHGWRPGRLVEAADGCWLETWIQPPPHLLLVGGGPDALPLLHMARQLGWEVSVQDDRPAYARPESFAAAHCVLREPLDTLAADALLQSVDAAVIMAHHVQRDAAALRLLSQRPLLYLALVGPAARAGEVMQVAGLREDDLAAPLHAPAGLDVGGEGPEAVALSVLAECHAQLHGGAQTALSDPQRLQQPIHPQRA